MHRGINFVFENGDVFIMSLLKFINSFWSINGGRLSMCLSLCECLCVSVYVGHGEDLPYKLE